MPKKSILKKRTDVEPTSQDQSPQDLCDAKSLRNTLQHEGRQYRCNTIQNKKNQREPLPVDSYSSLGKPPSSLLTNVGNALPGDMRTSQISPSIIQRSGSQLVTGISSSAAAGGISLTTKQVLTSNAPNFTANDPLNRPHTSSAGSFLNTKEVGKGPSLGDGYLPLHDPGMSQMKLATAAASFPEQKREHKRSLTEIEEEERFLYGDEEEKTPEPSKEPPVQTPPKQTPPANVPKNTPDEKEYAKIHDLLKTIGLDIGVAEIGKLAVRTQERLHGKKLIPKVSPTPSQLPQQPQNTTASPSESKAKPEAEQKQKVVPKVAAKNETPAKPPVTKKPAPVAQQPGPTIKEKTPPVTPKTAAKEQSQPASKIETIGQPITTVQASSVSSAQAIGTVQSITTVQTPPVLVQPPQVAPVPDMTPPPISPSQVPMYSPYNPSPMMHNFSVPPPSFNPYTPYVPFPTSNWTMYPPPPVHQPPPPTHIPPPVSSPHLPTPQTTHARSNLRVIETNADFEAAAKNEPKTPTSTTELLAKHEAERRNKEAEKLKVLEELDTLKQDLKAKTINVKNLSTKVEQLRIQHGILLRKKRREKDGHKDPLLGELSNVIDSARRQISSLNNEIFETKHKQQQLIKVAEILGASPMDLADKKETYKEQEKSPLSPRDSSSDAKSSGSINEKNDSKTIQDSKERSDSSPATDKNTDVKPKGRSDSSGDVSPSASARLSGKAEDDVKPKRSSRSPKRRSDRRSSSSESSSSSSSDSEESLKSWDKSRSRSSRSSAPPSKVSPKKEDPAPFEVGDIFEYYDSGGHWCEDCNSLCMNVLEFLLHFHERKHHESLKQQQRPWVKTKKTEVSSPKKQKVTVALKGAEFMVPTKGYYCSLCDHSFPDHVEADEHLRTYSHNEKFKKYTDEYINYEVSRRERKKASLSAAQEAARKQAEQKRKLQNEEHSRSKKAKRDHEVDKSNSRRRSHTPSSPVKTDPKRKSKTPDKEPVKAPTFGKFTWKPTDDKNQSASNTENVEGAALKEEEAKGQNNKPKGIEIKLLGKPSNSQGKSPTSSSSTSSSTTSTLTTASIAASFMTPTSSDAPRIKVRPNLPVPLALLRKSNMTVNKPAPLNTFLSIKSADATSKSLPVVKSSAQTILSEDIVSKAFEGEEVVLKETQETKPQPIKTATKKDDANKNLVPNPTPSPETTTTSQPARGSELYDMLFKKVPADALQQGAKAKAGQGSKAAPSSKPASSTNASKTGSSNSSKITESKSSEKLQQGKSTSQSSQSPGHAAAPRISESQSKNVLPEPAKGVAGSSTNSTSKVQKLIGPLPKKEMGPIETKTVSKLEKAASQAGQGPSLSMNPLTGRLEYSSMQVSKPKETYKMKSPEAHKMKSPETTKTNPPEAQKVSVTHIQTGKEIKPLHSVVPVVEPSKPSYNQTSKLNQKFKREPLSLPTSLFGHISDPGCKDIKITHIATPKPTTDMRKSSESQPSSYKASISNQTMQQELESYYKLIATEEDPADLIPSEDEDPEAEVASAPHKVEIPEKKMKLENPPPAMKASANPMVPDVASEDVDDSDMACEVPDGPASNFSTSGLGMVQSSYSFSPTFGAKSRQPSNYSRGMVLMDRDYTRKTPTSTTAASYSKEELEALTTCDSD